MADRKLNWQRSAIGIIGLVFLVSGAATYLVNPETAAQFTGIAVRVGLLLCVIWLAMPQLEPMQSRIPGYLLLMGLILLVIVVARPKLGQVAAGVFVVALAVSWILKWLGKLAP